MAANMPPLSTRMGMHMMAYWSWLPADEPADAWTWSDSSEDLQFYDDAHEDKYNGKLSCFLSR